MNNGLNHHFFKEIFDAVNSPAFADYMWDVERKALDDHNLFESYGLDIINKISDLMIENTKDYGSSFTTFCLYELKQEFYNECVRLLCQFFYMNEADLIAGSDTFFQQ